MPKGSISSAIFWMFLISLLLFWLPVLGPLLAGIVGGKRAGTVSRALVAVLIPGFLFGCVLFFLGSALSGLPLLGVIAGAGGFILAIAHIGPLLVGAIVGGLLA